MRVLPTVFTEARELSSGLLVLLPFVALSQDDMWLLGCTDDDRPFIVLAETKPSKRHIPVWARYSPLRTRVEAHANTLSP